MCARNDDCEHSGRSALLARASDQTFTAFPTRLTNHQHVCRCTLATSLNIKQCAESVRLNQTLPSRSFSSSCELNSARSAMDQSRWWVRSREQEWVNSGERQGERVRARSAGAVLFVGLAVGVSRTLPLDRAATIKDRLTATVRAPNPRLRSSPACLTTRPCANG